VSNYDFVFRKYSHFAGGGILLSCPADPTQVKPGSGPKSIKRSSGMKNKMKKKTQGSLLHKPAHSISDETGAMVIESAMIFPLMIVITFLSIIMSVIYFQNLIWAAHQQKYTISLGEWAENEFRHADTGLIIFDSRTVLPLYSDWTKMFGEDALQKEKIMNTLNKADAPYDFFKFTAATKDNIKSVNVTNNIFIKCINVDFKQPFGNKTGTLLYTKAEPAGTLRTIDFAAKGISSIFDTFKKMKN